MAGEELIPGETQDLSLPSGQEEKIQVFVRLRPLNDKEIARNDVSDWECINNNTIIFKNTLPERSMFPAAYSFDRVFGYDSPTKKLYEEGVKEVSLSVVSGINSSIFAYGQTSSGKTYTMRGITEYAASDIYNYVEKHKEREFVLKFSAMEIYNESVRDLLISDTTPLRLLDDPERGTVVERLTEETLRDKSHMEELLAICEAQRQIGETSLNETSSRSHQILRLTIESSAREYIGADKSTTLTATVNFVDLAGSERASQAVSAGVRLKEGSHINRSLLTLGKVVRKLSKGKNAHIPYRDSKLTRILQNSLGGNARTAIICTMSPARSQIEQSRNTLLFASCAKEVATNAQVNVVMSDKALVKQLQRELARLESEMKSLGSTSGTYDSATLLKEKELIIEQMEKEIRELTRQRDLAELRMENLLQSRLDEYSVLDSPDAPNSLHAGLDTCNKTPKFQNSENPEGDFVLDDSAPNFVGLDPCQGWEETAQKTDEEFEGTGKEVGCNETGESSINEKTEGNVFSPGPRVKNGRLSETEATDENAVSSPCEGVGDIETEESSIKWEEEANALKPGPGEKEGNLSMTEATDEDALSSIEVEESSIKRETENDVSLQGPEEEGKGEVAVSRPQKKDKESSPTSKDPTYDALKQKIQELQRTIHYLVNLYPQEQTPSSSEADACISSSAKINRSASCRAILMSTPSSLAFEKAEHSENTPPNCSVENIAGSRRLSELKYGAKFGNISRKDSQTSISGASVESQSFKESDADDTTSSYEHSENTPSPWFEKAEHKPTDRSEKSFHGGPIGIPQKLSEWKYEIQNLSRKHSQTSVNSASIQSPRMKESETEDSSIRNFVPGQSEMGKVQPPRKYGDDLKAVMNNMKDAGLKKGQDAVQQVSTWPAEFESRRKEIIELWNACNVPLVHRTYFYLLFKGDPSDSVYMEVELRRLSFLKGGNISKESLNASLKALYREREALSKQIHQKFSRREREELYQKWDIALNTKQRSLQLARRIWTYTKDLNHVNESASLVAKLVGFVKPGQAPKEVFGLSFLAGSTNRKSFCWIHNKSTSVLTKSTSVLL
ncbi:kinesin-like protein KIN-7E isoform X2 [Pistacia vera]|uniref:kinesin-like protein KIN-7E isoform X2 n=1 Tax=Pistacia vera TaxID=55513 RepID=UPI001262B1A5|nr:kinesin-like protein KIN-7E isoform X2 [Pistacia vera]